MNKPARRQARHQVVTVTGYVRSRREIPHANAAVTEEPRGTAMIDARLFTHSDPRFGPAETNLNLVQGVTKLAVVYETIEVHYRKNGPPEYLPYKSGQTRIVLYREGKGLIDLATIPGVIAVSINNEDIFWFWRGECTCIEQRTTGQARALVQEHCRPQPGQGYELL